MTGDARTVLICNPGADLYGSDRMVVENVRALVGAGYRVVVTVPEQGPLIELLTQAGGEVVVQPTPIIRKSLMSPRGLVQLAREALSELRPGRRLIKRVNPGTVLVNTITAPLWFPLARVMRRRVVCHVHEAEKSASGLVRRVLYLPLLACHRIVINSQFALGVLAGAAPWLVQRTTVVYNVVAGPPEATPARAELDGPVELLFIGRLSHRKGPHVAIEAVRLLTERGTPAVLSLLGAVFPGNESYEQHLRDQVARAGLGERVRFLGFRPEVWPTIASSDIVIIPSTVDEPFGNTAVEASLAARPLIVSDIAGLKEASQAAEARIAVPASDAAAIADAVEAIVADWEHYRSLALSDSTTVANRFSASRYARGLLAGMGLVPLGTQ